MEYLFLILGFALLLYGGDFLVKGSVSLAKRFNVPSLVVGLTIVSFGTSAPELFVSLVAAVKNHPEVAIGNVIGSNIANVALVLGLTAIIFPISVRSSSVKLDAPFMLLISLLFWWFMQNMGDYQISRVEGGVFMLLLAGYTLTLLYLSRKNKVKTEVEELEKAGRMKLWKVIAMLVGAYAGLALGSELLVTNASKIAENFGVSERVIAITIVAFGTSLPELATSVIAAFKKEMDISIGNIIGSNIFNVLAVLGITGLVKPIPVSKSFLDFDIFWMLGTSFLLFLFILPFKGGKLTRPKAGILFGCYCVYIYLLYFSNA